MLGMLYVVRCGATAPRCRTSREQDISQKNNSVKFSDMVFEESSPTEMKTVHRHFWRQFTDTFIYLKPKVTLHCYYICLFWALVSGILNVFNSY